jgi:hypothetical protein
MQKLFEDLKIHSLFDVKNVEDKKDHLMRIYKNSP